MTIRERVTVIIPTRNRCRLLRQTLGTVRAQEGADFDVVVVDEGSTDDTPVMLRGLERAGLTVLRHEQAKGVSAARNTGLAAATGKWVAFVDDDDIWAPAKLSAQLAAVRVTPRVGWASAGAVLVNDRLHLRSAERTPDPSTVGNRLLAHNVIPGGASGVVARTDLVREVGGFDKALSNLADYDLWIRLGLAASLAVVDRPLVGYRVHNSGMAHNVRRAEQELGYVEAKYRAVRRERGVDFRREVFLRYFGALYLRQGDRVQAMRIHRELALRHRDRPLYSLSLAAVGGLWPGVQQIRDRAQGRNLPPVWRREAESWIAPLRS